MCLRGRVSRVIPAQLVYADAQEDVERTGEIARQAEALETEAGDAYRDAQKQAFQRDRE